MVAAGYGSKQKFVDGVCGLEMPLISKLRRDAHLRPLYREPRSSGPGRPKTSDGKVTYSDLARWERAAADATDMALYHQVVTHPPWKRKLPRVVGQHLPPGRSALLFRTDVALSAPAIYR